ncbi:hypothetical protein B0T26DRAFT_753463 [Lasiosphaeria miniovina]|uniref:Uncharacterized protein n=1 Tax=Lasiosphaeria miniovina TaxID=1954250 RepID=A0AA40DRY6_9PEZI|nr:uncharacterized protein B0T26DRAFT_753463 [Lasiosphaeria miniovina]KAK0713345.1 hypothetical protein B0T26DRAFT_753463 [Lasiosphaeria miniovina]
MTKALGEDITSARRDINYEPGAKNIVIAGNLDAGKSSLINALRNCVIADSAYAPTGASDTTMLFAYDMVVLAHESSLTEPVIVAPTTCDMHIRNYQDERAIHVWLLQKPLCAKCVLWFSGKS